MNRQGFASLGMTSQHLQQGQQWAHWQQPAPAQSVPAHAIAAQQTHFSAIRSTALGSSTPMGRYDLAASEDTQTANTQPVPERWVF